MVHGGETWGSARTEGPQPGFWKAPASQDDGGAGGHLPTEIHLQGGRNSGRVIPALKIQRTVRRVHREEESVSNICQTQGERPARDGTVQ